MLCEWRPQRSRAGRLRDAPLAAGALNDQGGRDALVTGVQVALAAAPRRIEVAPGAAQEILSQVVEEVAREAHVDPRVATTVEAGQQHGDDEGHSCRKGQERNRQVEGKKKKKNTN